MSVQRSPPSDPKLKAPTVSHHASDSALNITAREDTDDNFCNVTKRHKRSFNEYTEIPEQYMTEIKKMIAEMKAEQMQKLETLNSTINSLVKQNEKLQTSVDFMSSKYDDLLNKIDNLQRQNNDYKKSVTSLEKRIEILERNARSCTIEIRNIPKSSSENKKSMINVIKTVGEALCPDTPIQDFEIKEIYRSKSDALVIDFNNSARKESIVSAYRKHNKSKRLNQEPGFSTQNIKLAGTPKQIFISESLTSKAGRLHFVARQLVKKKKLTATWTSFGKVYVKKEEGQMPICIEEEDQLHKITS